MGQVRDDADAIRRLLHAYGDAVLARDPVAWGALWTADAVWDLGPDRRLEGREALVEHWRSSLDAYVRVVQLYLSNTATIDGDRAAGRAYLIELTEPRDRPREMFVGWYDDHYARTEGGWRFAARSLTRRYRGPGDLSGLFFD